MGNLTYRIECVLLAVLCAGFFPLATFDVTSRQTGVQTAHATESYTVAAQHPRVWLTPSRVTQLRQYAARNGGAGTTRWQQVKSAADITMVQGNPPIETVTNLALAYQVTGNVAYCQKAINITLGLAIPTETLRMDSYFYYRTALPPVTATLDWCYDQMTGAQRVQVAGWLMDRADDVWPDTNPARVGGWATDTPSNNYFSGFLMTWPAALAAYGIDSRATTHINLGLTKYRTMLEPFLKGWGTGGVFAESTNYDSTSRVALILDAYLTATGNDLFNEPADTFMHDSLYWRIHSTTPAKDAYYPLGDQPRVSIAPLSAGDRLRALIPSHNTNDQTLRSYAKYWLTTINPSYSPGNDAAYEFIYLDEDLAATDYTAALPTWNLATGPGVLFKRSDWSTSATYWGIWAGPLERDHQNRDVNGFMIYKNGWLVGNATIWSTDGEYSQTRFSNNLTFGGHEQFWLSDPATDTNRILKQEVGSDYTYFAGNGTKAYNQYTPVMNDYVRKVVSLGDSVFVVYDRADVADASWAKEWHLQAEKPVAINGRSYSFDNGNAKLFGTSLLPTGGTTLTNDEIFAGYTLALRSDVQVGSSTLTIDANLSTLLSAGSVLQLGSGNSLERVVVQSVGSTAALTTPVTLTAPVTKAHVTGDTFVMRSSNRLNVVSSNNQAAEHLLNVLEVAPQGQASAAANQALIASTGQLEGMETSALGGWAVLLGKNDLVTDTISYQTASHRAHHILTDLKPSFLYTLTVRDGSNTLLRTAQITTTQNGSAEFASSASNELSYTLTPQGAAPKATIALSKSVDKTSAASGDVLTYTITYTNVGTADANNVVVTDAIPTGSTYVAGSASGNGSISNGNVTWIVPTLAQSGSGSVSFKVTAK